MARYSYNQVYQIIDEAALNPTFLALQKDIERQHYLNFFAEMHNYISENIIELPFDADVILEEDKSVWDKSDTGWGGFWRNIWRVLKNFFETFWKLIKSIVGISSKEQVPENKIKENASAAQQAIQASQSAPDSGIKSALESNPQNKEEFKTALNEILADVTKLKERYAKTKEPSQTYLNSYDALIDGIKGLVDKIDKGTVTKADLTNYLDPLLQTAANSESNSQIQKLMNFLQTIMTVLCMCCNACLSYLNVDLNLSLEVQNAPDETAKKAKKVQLAGYIMDIFIGAYPSLNSFVLFKGNQGIVHGNTVIAKDIIDTQAAVGQLLISQDFKNDKTKAAYASLNITDEKNITSGINTVIKNIKERLDGAAGRSGLKEFYKKIFTDVADKLQIEGGKVSATTKTTIEYDPDSGLLTSSNALEKPDKVNQYGDANTELAEIFETEASLKGRVEKLRQVVGAAGGYVTGLFSQIVANKEVSFARVQLKIKKLANAVTNIFKKKSN